MKKKLVIGMLVLAMAVSLTACSSKDTATVGSTQNTEADKVETSSGTAGKDVTDTADKKGSTDEKSAYGLTKEETERLAESVKAKVTTQYLEKYGIDAASFTFPEAGFEIAGIDFWSMIDVNYLKREYIEIPVTVGETAGDKSMGVEQISDNISDGTLAFKESAKEQSEFCYGWFSENNASQEGDLAGAIYEGIAEFLNSLDDAKRADVLYDVYDANIYQAEKDAQGKTLHTMFDQVIIENVSF